MIILHVSDTHGDLPALNLHGVDAIVHSGDIFPNRTRGNRFIEPAFQRTWLEANAERFRTWTGGVPLLFIPGNHDYIEDAEATFRNLGIEATDLTGRIVELGGLRFYGFPWVPFFGGEWNWEASYETIANRIAEMPDGVDVLVSHGPLEGTLDQNERGEHCGSSALAAGVFVRVGYPGRLPSAMLHGHIHESAGVTMLDGMLVSNAAQTQHRITL